MGGQHADGGTGGKERKDGLNNLPGPRVRNLRQSRDGKGLAILTTGVQNVENAFPTFMAARASRPICAPVACQRLLLKLIAVVIGNLGFFFAVSMLRNSEVTWSRTDAIQL